MGCLCLGKLRRKKGENWRGSVSPLHPPTGSFGAGHRLRTHVWVTEPKWVDASWTPGYSHTVSLLSCAHTLGTCWLSRGRSREKAKVPVALGVGRPRRLWAVSLPQTFLPHLFVGVGSSRDGDNSPQLERNADALGHTGCCLLLAQGACLGVQGTEWQEGQSRGARPRVPLPAALLSLQTLWPA